MPAGLSSTAEGGSRDTGFARVPLDQRTVSAVLRYADEPDTRRSVYLAAHSGPEANRAVLNGLLRARHESAKILGFESHAHFATSPLLAEHPDAPRALLERMASECRDRAGEEIEAMLRLAGRDGMDGTVSGWVMSYVIGMERAKACELVSAAVASYFPLDRVISGVGALVDRVFGVKPTEVAMEPGENWHAKVRKLRVTSAPGAPARARRLAPSTSTWSRDPGSFRTPRISSFGVAAASVQISRGPRLRWFATLRARRRR